MEGNDTRGQRGLTIQEMAARCGVGAHTLRSCERFGLRQGVARDGSGRRRAAPQGRRRAPTH